MLNARHIQRSAIIVWAGLRAARVRHQRHGRRPPHARHTGGRGARTGALLHLLRRAARNRRRPLRRAGAGALLLVLRQARTAHRHAAAGPVDDAGGRRSRWPSPPRPPSPPQARPHSAASASAAARPKSPASPNNHRCPPHPMRRAPESSRIPLLLKHPAAAQQQTRDVEPPARRHCGRAAADRPPTSPAPKWVSRRPG